MRFPHQISSSEATAVKVILRIHGRLRLEEPLDHGIAAFGGCHVQRCFASGAAARGQATGRTQRNEGKKNSEKIWAPQKSKFWKFWPLKNPPWTYGTLWFWDVFRMFLWHRVGWKNCCLWCSIEAVSAMFAIKMYLDKLKHTPTLPNKSAHDWDTTSFENNCPVLFLCSWHFI